MKCPGRGAGAGYVRVLHTGVVIGPGFFEAVGEIFNGLGLPLAAPNEKACDGSAQTAHGPDEILHVVVVPQKEWVSLADSGAAVFACVGVGCGVRGVGCVQGFGGGVGWVPWVD